MTREDIEFNGEGGVTLRGWFYPAQNTTTPAPVVVLTHGMSGVKEMYLDEYASVFAEAGLNALVYDHRNFGDSDGSPRQELDPVLQVRDYRNAITYATTRPEVDKARVGAWGTSFSGGIALMVAAIDRRVKAVVAQVPMISGPATLDRLIRPDFLPHVRGNLDADRLNRFAGGEPAMLPAVSADPMGQAAMPQPDAYEWFTKVSLDRAPNWKNEITARSLEMAGEFDPGSFIAQISPTPLLMVIADEDACTPYALAFDAYERAREPKQLVVTHGGHFDFYEGPGFDEVSAAARDHFVKHLRA
ncbi:alpha/beta hydrolase [Nocardia rhizosphaerihabitans]|uniref:AB hydrolase-1 domain-containing protein n=1 Tax=Nocardia rhizosphaerihabitans TaxID=1691570 RepID=A0ABQ2L2U7_9NOCA|nr:alpha/beta hydrolase [Nocardia rhizosphaerihabitans]GGO00675.1 hypothetical protein GCM10011610_69880 [Nocardia rhizosphaerihabitans]